MKEVILTEFGTPLTVRDVPAPAPGPREVRVRVRHAGVNGIDLAVAHGFLRDGLPHRPPIVLGREFSGVVEAIGVEATRFGVGDEVFGIVPLAPVVEKGAWSESILLPEEGLLALKPKGATFPEAAALPWAGLTALQAIGALRLRAGERVLIVGATGGVGNYAIQIAAKAGAHVIATARPEGEAHVRRLGARETLDRSTASLADDLHANHPEGIDAILHLAGPAPAPGGLAIAVRPGGRIVSTMGTLDTQALSALKIEGVNLFMVPNLADLERVARLFETDGTRVPVQGSFPATEANAAVDAFKRGTLGKLLLAFTEA